MVLLDVVGMRGCGGAGVRGYRTVPHRTASHRIASGVVPLQNGLKSLPPLIKIFKANESVKQIPKFVKVATANTHHKDGLGL